MNRRQMLVGVGVGVALAASRANAEVPQRTTSPGGLSKAAASCAQIAHACLRHCLTMLATGNGSMGPCSKAVSDLIPAVEALTAIAAGGSRHVTPFAKVVSDIAKDCKTECDKHPTMAPCKACADSCAALIAEIAKA